MKLFLFFNLKNIQFTKYHKINQASGNTLDTKPCRNRRDTCETVTLLHRSAAADGTVDFLRFQVNRTVK